MTGNPPASAGPSLCGRNVSFHCRYYVYPLFREVIAYYLGRHREEVIRGWEQRNPGACGPESYKDHFPPRNVLMLSRAFLERRPVLCMLFPATTGV